MKASLIKKIKLMIFVGLFLLCSSSILAYAADNSGAGAANPNPQAAGAASPTTPTTQAGGITPSYTLLTAIPTANGDQHTVDTTKLSNYLQILVIALVSLSAVVAVFMIVYGGILYMSTDNFEKKTDGRKIIQRTLLGFLLIIAAYLVMYAINPNLLKLSAFDNIPNFGLQTGVNGGVGSSGQSNPQPLGPGCWIRTSTTQGQGTNSTNVITYSVSAYPDSATCNAAITNATNEGQSLQNSTCICNTSAPAGSVYRFKWATATYYPKGSIVQVPGDPTQAQNILDDGGFGPFVYFQQDYSTLELCTAAKNIESSNIVPENEVESCRRDNNCTPDLLTKPIGVVGDCGLVST